MYYYLKVHALSTVDHSEQSGHSLHEMHPGTLSETVLKEFTFSFTI